MKAKRRRGSRHSNTVSRVSNSYILYGEKTMCVALDFFAVLLYPKRMNCVLSKQWELYSHSVPVQCPLVSHFMKSLRCS